MRLLGRQPPQSTIRGRAVKLQWLQDQFTVVSEYLTHMKVEQYARGYIFHMIGTWWRSQGARGHVPPHDPDKKGSASVICAPHRRSRPDNCDMEPWFSCCQSTQLQSYRDGDDSWRYSLPLPCFLLHRRIGTVDTLFLEIVLDILGFKRKRPLLI